MEGKIIKFVCRGDFYFTVEKTLTDKIRAKKVYLGSFVSVEKGGKNDSAPTNCMLDTQYCLKEVWLNFPLDHSSTPQHRHFWDYFPFEGENIREILAKNEDTERFINDVKKSLIDVFENKVNGVDDPFYKCMIIEPKYDKFSVEDFPSPIEKIDCMLQIVSGLKQLRSSNFFENRIVLAHRDLKFLNVMVEKGDTKKIIRLIDFPSIKTIDINSSGSDDATVLGSFSASNTAPEDVVDEYVVDEKVDVWALGGMLAEIFGVWSYSQNSEAVRNPLRILVSVERLPLTDQKACENFYRKKDSEFPSSGSSRCGWLEQTLKNKNISADWTSIGTGYKTVRKLFREALVIDPEKRIRLDDFEKQLERIKQQMERANVASGHSKNKKQFFIFDSTQIAYYKASYLNAAKAVMSNESEIIPVFYKWNNRNGILVSNPNCLSGDDEDGIATIEALEEALGDKKATSNTDYSKSELKACLYDVLQLFKSGGNNYDSAIHIFTPILPRENNMCPFKSGGQKLEVTDILKECQDIKIYVHVPESETSGKEDWYSVESFVQCSGRRKTKEPIVTKPDEKKGVSVVEAPVSPKKRQGRVLGGKRKTDSQTKYNFDSGGHKG